MAFSDYLERSVQSGNMLDVRGALIGYIDSDPAFKHYGEPDQLESAIQYVSQKCGSPFEEHDGQDLGEVTHDKWDDEYFQRQKVRLRRNFSRERLDHLRQVGAVVNGKSWIYEKSQSASNDGRGSCSGNRRNSDTGGTNTKKTEAPTVNPALLAVGAVAVIVVIVGIVILVK